MNKLGAFAFLATVWLSVAFTIGFTRARLRGAGGEPASAQALDGGGLCGRLPPCCSHMLLRRPQNLQGVSARDHILSYWWVPLQVGSGMVCGVLHVFSGNFILCQIGVGPTYAAKHTVHKQETPRGSFN